MNNEGTEDLSSGGVALAGIASDSYRNAYFFCNRKKACPDHRGKARTASASKLCIYRKCVYALLLNTPNIYPKLDWIRFFESI